MYLMRVLVLLALQLAIVQCFNWDIVMGIEKRLEFYYNGTLTHTEDIPSAEYIVSTTYDPVHYRVIFADSNYPNTSISSFDLSTRKIQHLVTGKANDYGASLDYDPFTQLLFWRNGLFDIYSMPLNPASSNKAIDGNHKVTTIERDVCYDIAVDSCGGYVYWITNEAIGRVRFDGSEREIIINKHVYLRLSLVIDPQSQRMYWIESIYTDLYYLRNTLFIQSANLNGKDETTLYVIYKHELYANSMSVSKDFIYWRTADQDKIWQLHKNPRQREETKLFSISHSDYCYYCQNIAANYTTKEQTQGNLSCEPLKNLVPTNSVPESTDGTVLCFHGTKVSGETRCECAHGFTGERCEVPICQNYCMQGDCSVSADGQPECRCKTGFAGERCEVNACHGYCLNSGVCSMNKEGGPACECTAGYDGERCEVPICKDYCLQGNCRVSKEGKPKCSCYDGYSGERCEVNACHDYCLYNGACSLNEEDEPICECTEGYEGKKCEVSIRKDYCLQGNCSLGTEGQPKYSCTAGFSGERCGFNACNEYCLNNGVCSLNEENVPVCQCSAGYDGKRCDVPAVIMKCIPCFSMLRDMLSPDATPVTLDKEESTCASTVV